MSYSPFAASTYESIDHHVQIEGASAHELVNLLLKGALSKLVKAKRHLLQKNYAAKGEEIGKVIAILTELQSCLNKSVVSDITDNLDMLYTYISQLISTANVNNDADKIDEAYQLLNHIRETWSMIPHEEQY